MLVICYRCGHPITAHDVTRKKCVHRAYGDYHEKCYLEICKAGPRIRALSLMLALLSVLPALGAEPLAPQMICTQGDSTHVACEFKHYFGVTDPHWTVSEGSTFLADGDGLAFRPVIDTKERTIRASIPNGENQVVFEVRVRRNPETEKAEFRNDTDHKAVEMAWSH